ncbi:MAG: hypothetical protein HQ495_00170 [Alphaproteobacteria bacterium]|nr:hypothetical protein [Alphaproteobacteria bacterium]
MARRWTIQRIALATALIGVGLTGCTMSNGVNAPDAGIGFRESRAAQAQALRDYQGCRDEALELDTLARQGASTARYLASARVAESCERVLGPNDTALVPIEDRMRTYALSIQNNIKGGDLAAARAALDRFGETFAGHDLYFGDGSSFLETADLLLRGNDATDSVDLTGPNISDSLRTELRRVRYWVRN